MDSKWPSTNILLPAMSVFSISSWSVKGLFQSNQIPCNGRSQINLYCATKFSVMNISHTKSRSMSERKKQIWMVYREVLEHALRPVLLPVSVICLHVNTKYFSDRFDGSLINQLLLCWLPFPGSLPAWFLISNLVLTYVKSNSYLSPLRLWLIWNFPPSVTIFYDALAQPTGEYGTWGPALY